MHRWSFAVGLSLIAAAATASGSDQRSVPLGGGSSQAVLPEPPHQETLGALGPVSKFAWSSHYATQFSAWPTEVSMGASRVKVGARLPLVLIHCQIDARGKRWKASCAAGAGTPPLHLFDSGGANVSERGGPARLYSCFDVVQVAPSAAELRTVERRLEQRKPPWAPGGRTDAAWWISVEHREIDRVRVKLGGRPPQKTVTDATERVVSGSSGRVPVIQAQVAALPFIVPLGADGKPLPEISQLLMLRYSFPGQVHYVARALRKLRLDGLSAEMRAVLAYDKAAAAFASGDAAEGARAFAELHSSLQGELRQDLRELLQRGVSSLEPFASGMLVTFDPCKGAEVLP